MNKNRKKWQIGIGVSALVIITIVLLAFNITNKNPDSATEQIDKSEPVPVNQVKTNKTIKTEKPLPEDKTDKKEDKQMDKSKEKKDKQAGSKDKTDKTADEKANEKANEKQAVKAVKPVTKYVNISSLNVRSGAGTDHPAISAVTQGQAITVYGTADSWSQIKTDSIKGWVSSKYLTAKKPEVKQDVPNNKATASKDAAKPKTNTANSGTKPASNLNDADKLKTVGGNRQLILVTTNGTGTSRARIQTFEKDANGKWNRQLNTTGFVGKYGLTYNMNESSAKSPIGKYTIGTAFGRQGNPGTKLSFRPISGDDVWVDDPKSKLYNTWQSRSKTQNQWTSAEKMDIPAYSYGFAINYNTSNTPYKGSAIFFHISNSYTLGCTGTARANVINILKWLDPSKNPVIIQAPEQDLGNY